MTQEGKAAVFAIALRRQVEMEGARSDYGWASDRAVFASAAYSGCEEIISGLGLEQEYGQWERNREAYKYD